MSDTIKQLNAANSKNLRLLQPKQRSVEQKEVFPHNRVYLQQGVGQSGVKEVNRQKLIEQNKRLKQQVLLLAEQMGEIVGRSSGKKKYGLNLQQGWGEMQRLQVKKQEVRLVELRNQMFNLRKEIEFVLDGGAVLSKENAIKELQAEIKVLQSEKIGFAKVRREQERALAGLRNDGKYEEKIQKSRAQVLKLKQQCKVLFGKISQNERLLLRNHQKVVGRNVRMKEVQQKIKQSKQKLKKGTSNIVTIQMISEIEDEIMKLQSEYKQSQANWLEKIGNLQTEHGNRRVQEEKKLLILKEKEREVRLNQIRLKEFRKLISHSRSQNKSEAIQNLREFRNKRNIKYLQKNN